MRLTFLFCFFPILVVSYLQAHAQGIKLGEMKGGFDEEGCYLFYSASKARYKSEAWIFMSNGYEARVKINGKRNSLKKVGPEDNANPDYNVFGNAAYEVILKTRHLNDDENGEIRSGSIMVKNKRTGAIGRFSIYGWIGCE